MPPPQLRRHRDLIALRNRATKHIGELGRLGSQVVDGSEPHGLRMTPCDVCPHGPVDAGADLLPADPRQACRFGAKGRVGDEQTSAGAVWCVALAVPSVSSKSLG